MYHSDKRYPVHRAPIGPPARSTARIVVDTRERRRARRPRSPLARTSRPLSPSRTVPRASREERALLEEIFRPRFRVRHRVGVPERRFVRQPRDRRLDLARVDEDRGRRARRRRCVGGHSRVGQSASARREVVLRDGRHCSSRGDAARRDVDLSRNRARARRRLSRGRSRPRVEDDGCARRTRVRGDGARTSNR